MVVAFALPMTSYADVVSPNVRQQISIYSQNTLDNRDQNFVNQTRIKSSVYEFDSSSSAHLGVWFEQDAKTESALIYNDNQISPFAGIGWASKAFPVGATADAFYVMPLVKRAADAGSSANGAELVGRLNLFHSDLFEARQERLFAETYSSLLYTTRLDDNLIFEHWTKSGLRLRPLSNIYTDAFAEVRAHKNARAWAWEDYGDLRGGARVGAWVGEFNIAVSATARIVELWGEKTPDVAALLVLGGTL